MTFKTKEEAEVVMKAARAFIGDIELAERKRENQPFVGGFYRVRSNYSCPSKPSDYWYVYTAITRMDEDGFLCGWQFSRDQYGKVEVEPVKTRIYPHIYLKQKVSRVQFEREFAKVLKAAASLHKRSAR